MEGLFKRNEKILLRDCTALLIIDIQEKILAVMHNHKIITDNTLKAIKSFKELNIPIFYTEQYPKGLGPTAAVLLKELEGLSSIQKMSFSCFGADDLFKRLKDNNVSQVVIAGIETHVCVQQTVLDLLANEFQVNVLADATSSRKEIDYNTALDRMRIHGAEITTTESVLFELLDVCGTDEFKKISKIIK
jgi:nicotinamidase-related amidase